LGFLVLAALLAAGDDPEYPLGRLRLPPIAEAASPFRLVDLGYAFARDGGTLSSFETRLRVGSGVFLGGEVTGDRLGLFFDTQRLELGVSEENGAYEVEGSYRLPRFHLGTRAFGREDDWSVFADGSVRVTNDLEIVLGYGEDLHEPEVDAGTRETRAASTGFLYQRGSRLEVSGDARFSLLRTAGGFDEDVATYRAATLWNWAPIELEGEISHREASGRISSEEWSVFLGAQVEIFSHFLAHATTSERWEPGILLFEEAHRAGLTFFGRRHRFPRSAEAAERVNELQKRANALGYNERRVYDVDGLRSFRERLGLSRAREELEAELDELYRAQVRDRNVPLLGFEFAWGDDAVNGFEFRAYQARVGIPWRIGWPFSRSEDLVEFVTADFVVREEMFPANLRAVSRELSVAIWLNRDMSLVVRWENPGRTPDEIAQETSHPTTLTLSYEYALGR
jgi:hypothetical protein